MSPAMNPVIRKMQRLQRRLAIVDKDKARVRKIVADINETVNTILTRQ